MISVFDRKEDCCGCTACENICPTEAIKMVQDEEGFLYPYIDQGLCINCGNCTDVCAFQNERRAINNNEISEVYAVKHKSNDVRFTSSSGGAFTAISDYILSKEGVVYGATFDENFNVVHKRQETYEGRDSLRGSKYVQSNLKQVYDQVKSDLQGGRFVLFTGTPCQVAGINSFLVKARIDSSKLITTDIICHGTPSNKLFHDYVLFLEKKSKSKLKNYNFRSKVVGWKHTEVATFYNGKHTYNTLATQIFKKLFYSNLCLRPSCYECRYTSFTRPSDITIADYWGVEKHLPEFTDNLGVSAVLINSHKGKEVFANLTESIYMEKSSINDCAERQTNLYKPTSKNSKRNEFWSDYFEHGFTYIAKRYGGYGIKGKTKRIIAITLRKLGLLDR